MAWKPLSKLRPWRALARQHPCPGLDGNHRSLSRLRLVSAIRYPLVELLSAGLWWTATGAHGFNPATPAWLNLVAGVLLVSLLLPLTLIDLDHLWLPEPLCRAGVIAGLTASLIAASTLTTGGAALMLSHLLGASAALLVLEGLSAIAEKALGQPALGLGDAKLAGLGGAWLGLQGVAIAMLLAIVGGGGDWLTRPY